MEVQSATNNNVALKSVASTQDSSATSKSSELKAPTTTEEFNEQNKEISKEELDSAIENLNSQMEMLDTNIEFGYNDKLNSLYVNVMEKSTGKLIRQFPTEQTMKLAEHFKEIVGMIFDKKG